MNPLEKLAEHFKKFPGIGPRQARRFAYFVLSQHADLFNELVSSMQNVREKVTQCESCLIYFTHESTERECGYCRNPRRSIGSLIVVEKDVDVQVIEKSGAYNGMYFVLGGIIPLHEDTVPKYVHLQALIRRITHLIPRGLSEIIFALSANSEGDATQQKIQTLLTSSINKKIKISVFGRGLSTGTEIEYLDSDTLKSALNGRK